MKLRSSKQTNQETYRGLLCSDSGFEIDDDSETADSSTDELKTCEVAKPKTNRRSLFTRTLSLSAIRKPKSTTFGHVGEIGKPLSPPKRVSSNPLVDMVKAAAEVDCETEENAKGKSLRPAKPLSSRDLGITMKETKDSDPKARMPPRRSRSHEDYGDGVFDDVFERVSPSRSKSYDEALPSTTLLKSRQAKRQSKGSESSLGKSSSHGDKTKSKKKGSKHHEKKSKDKKDDKLKKLKRRTSIGGGMLREDSCRSLLIDSLCAVEEDDNKNVVTRMHGSDSSDDFLQIDFLYDDE
mmetsp:Transcript_11999/g.29138  ORF Transcript_11999/g.29138 Transcript_11999/m.29138 type:complete len:295 (+) Transcript_11999:143-1027(+)